MDVALEFARLAADCTSLGELRALLESVSLDLGFKHFAIVHNVRFRRDDPQFLSLDNYPESWAEEFVGQRLFVDDPVLHASTRTAKGFSWSDVADLLPLKPRHCHVMERSARYGMGPGFTVPSNIPGEPNGSCSFAAKPGRVLKDNVLQMAQLIGLDAFHAARRIQGKPLVRDVPHLSRRQLDVVRGMAAFGSDKAIARAHGLSPETVHRYAKSAIKAYGTSDRTRLVVAALRDGQISFDDCAVQGQLDDNVRRNP